MGGDYKGYRKGDFPVTEEACASLIFLPVLSDAAEGAADRILAAIRKAVDKARSG
jgi:dTDP-4-amino-4,6-dideoxygalactose transaminase